jgi:Transglycosylase SLT domain
MALPPSRRRRLRRLSPRAGIALLACAVAVVVAVIVASSGGGSGPPPLRLPLPGTGHPARAGDPFAFVPGRESDFVARATAGNAHVLFVKSPGGVLATASRVAAFRPLVDRATAGTGIDPNLLEAIVFVESAGRPNVIAGQDPANASGLTQILADTGASLLGMHVDLARSRSLTARIDRAAAAGRFGLTARLERRRAAIDDRFDPAKALAATARYLEIAQQRLGRADLAVVSYHMGIGNLSQVLADYDGGRAVPYAQLYFDTAPDRHPTAYELLSSFGDDSSLYYWKVLGAAQIMATYRTGPAALGRLASLHTAAGSAAEVLHPPASTESFPDPGALARAYAKGTIVPLPANAAPLGLAYDPSMGSLAPRLRVSAALYRGLRAPALDLLIELAARVRSLSGGAQPLTVAATVTDGRYQQLLGTSDPPAAAGYSFTLVRRYVRRSQAAALQAVLDRLQSLNLIAWVRYPSTLEVTVASDASRAIASGP